MVAFIDDHRGQFGVEPICRVLPIAPSTYFKRKAEERDPRRRSARAQQDTILRAIIQRIWNEHHQVYGPRKVWKQMGRENLRAARCRVRRLMREMGSTVSGRRSRPVSVPIAYSVNGQDYIATVVDPGGSQSNAYVGLVPELQNPPDHGATLWVFEVPKARTTSSR